LKVVAWRGVWKRDEKWRDGEVMRVRCAMTKQLLLTAAEG